MEHVASLAVARIERFLEQEPIVWLSTVRPDGAPHIVPIWFWWDGDALLVFSKPDAQKVRNLRARPAAMLALGDAEEDFDVGLIEGRAEILDRPTRDVMPAAHLEKYAEQMAAIGLTAAEYAETYSLVIRIVPDRFVGWHGRTLPASARRAGAPAQSLVEPRNTTLDPNGEPLPPRAPRHRHGPNLRERLGLPLTGGLGRLVPGLPSPNGAGAL
jgi:PPOX class probable F420-dependent enzyme